MKKYVVLGERYNKTLGKSLPFYYYVIAHNKMDAVRAFKIKFNINDYYQGGVYLGWDNDAEYGKERVWEYKEPIFECSDDYNF